MYNWKVIIEHAGIIFELLIKAKSYSDAYINSEMSYPDCRIISIKLTKGVDKSGKYPGH
jgi:hypothetical protein